MADRRTSPRVISVASIKGGVGKSTTCLILAKLLSQEHKVLLIDMDPQSSITSYYGNLLDEQGACISEFNIHQVLKGERFIGHAVINVERNLDIIAGYYTLKRFLYDVMERYRCDLFIKISDTNFYLKDAIRHLSKKYDYILIDTTPATGPILSNALVVSNYVITPVVCQVWTYESIELIYEEVRNELKLDIPMYTLATMYRNRSTHFNINRKLQERDDFLGTVKERESLNKKFHLGDAIDMKSDYVDEYRKILNNFMLKSGEQALKV
ncbi:ParA family protein [Borrelia sp. RT5S]|uniref:ParA family protein n=1 Tax=Borrelia sp. RT5S TaxID=2898581 RepID=UPI001E2AC36F|nr:ParA family protein [Borrelia sp. RT5S]UGQ16730.1 ParA family protein [Borrelia sp. RT5S]